jgi:hypothetical protein
MILRILAFLDELAFPSLVLSSLLQVCSFESADPPRAWHGLVRVKLQNPNSSLVPVIATFLLDYCCVSLSAGRPRRPRPAGEASLASGLVHMT